MVEHDSIRQLISLYFDGEASPEEVETVKAHIKECVDCARYYQDLSKLSKSLQSWTDESLSPDLEQKINQSFLTLKQEEHKMKTQTPLFRAGVGGGVLVTLLVTILVTHNYTKQSLERRTREAGQYLAKQGQQLSDQKQYKPYHLSTNYKVGTEGKKERVKTAADDIGDQFSVSNARSSKAIDKSEAVHVGRGLARSNKGLRSKAVSGMQSSKYDSNLPVSSPEQVSYERKFFGAVADEDGVRLGRPVYEAEVDSAPSVAGGLAIWPEPPFHPRPQGEERNTEQYDRIYENQFLTASENPLSTFSIDVDTASYSNMRRFLNNNQMPPEDAVRIEEMINYFSYDYPRPAGKHPFSITTEAAICPWNTEHELVMVGLKGKTLEEGKIPPSNLVFLLDVSGSMNQPNKLPLLKNAFKMMVNQITDQERVAIVVYAGAAGTVLESTPGSNKHKILQAIDNLRSGGSTAGGAGIQLAYQIAKDNFIKGGNNRVILATDGDFNVGVSSNGELVRMIEENRHEGVFLTVLGFGGGNYKDTRMEQIANKGNGNYYYIDTQKEAKKVLVNELGSTLFAIAKDVKLQIEFNPAEVKAYRLIGYENRILTKEDFNDDTKDAGELGAGHSVTALYEIVPADSEETFQNVDALKYQQAKVVSSGDLMTVKLRYKNPDADKSQLIEQAITRGQITQTPQGNFQFAASVAEFGLLLRDSQFKGKAEYKSVIKNAIESKGEDKFGYRQEFIDLVNKAQGLDNRSQTPGIIFK